MSAAEIQAELQELYSTLRGLQIAGLSTAAALTWVTFDIFLTLEDEVQYIWKAKWTYPKYLYILARYYGLVNLVILAIVSIDTNLSVDVCEKWIWFDDYSSTIFLASVVTQIFLLRINALYGGNTIMLGFLILCWLAELVITSVNTALTLRNVVIIPKPFGIPFPGCLPTNLSASSTLMSWIATLVVACIFYILTIYKLAQTMLFKDWFNVRHIFGRGSPYPIMTAFLRDGSVFFGMIFVAALINTVTTVVGGAILDIAAPWLKATYIIAGSRLILNLRSLSASPQTSLDMQSFSNGSSKPLEADAMPLQLRAHRNEEYSFA